MWSTLWRLSPCHTGTETTGDLPAETRPSLPTPALHALSAPLSSAECQLSFRREAAAWAVTLVTFDAFVNTASTSCTATSNSKPRRSSKSQAA